MKNRIYTPLCALLAAVILSCGIVQTAYGASAAELRREGVRALNELIRTSPLAAKLSKQAVGILVFPKVYRAGFIFGGQYGEGVLFINGRVSGYYSTIGGSYGLQVGAQAFGYAMFFMTRSALQYLNESDGWEIGTGPTLVVVDQGMSGNLSSSKMLADIYTFFFNQKGLMAGLGLQGNKITRFIPD